MSFSTAVGDLYAAVARVGVAALGRRRGAKALAQLSAAVAPVLTVETPNGTLRYRCPTAESVRAPARLLDWEPETTRWIEEHVGADDCLWDIGGHIGIFALQAALKVAPGRGQVIAFEPSAQNYAALSENIRLSGLSDRVSAYPVALSDAPALGAFHLSDTGAGKDGHAFGAPVNATGAFVPAYAQATIGFSVDAFIRLFGARRPDHIKLDVDSIEDRILAGAAETLKTVKSVLIEVESERTPAWREAVFASLAAAGLVEAPCGGVLGGRNRLYVRG